MVTRNSTPSSTASSMTCVPCHSAGLPARPGLRIRVVHRVVARVPGLPEAGCGQVPVRADLAGHLAEVVAEVLDRRPAPEPVAVVNAVDDEARLEHQGVR